MSIVSPFPPTDILHRQPVTIGVDYSTCTQYLSFPEGNNLFSKASPTVTFLRLLHLYVLDRLSSCWQSCKLFTVRGDAPASSRLLDVMGATEPAITAKSATVGFISFVLQRLIRLVAASGNLKFDTLWYHQQTYAVEMLIRLYSGLQGSSYPAVTVGRSLGFSPFIRQGF